MPVADDRLSRLGAASLVASCALGAVLEVVIQLTDAPWPESTTNPVTLAARAVSILAGLLLVLGLPVLAVRLARRSPGLAAAGLVSLIISFLVYDVIKGLLSSTLDPYLVDRGVQLWQDVSQARPVALPIMLLVGGFAHLFGGIFFGIAGLRSRAISRLAAWLLLGSSILFLGTFGPPDGPLGEWPDVASALALLAGLGLSGLELLGLQHERTQTAAAVRREAHT